MTSSETTFNDEELIARLRTLGRDFDDWDTAADRIEQLAVRKKALTKERDKYRKRLDETYAEWEANAKRLDVADGKLAAAIKAAELIRRCAGMGMDPSTDLQHMASDLLAILKGESHD